MKFKSLLLLAVAAMVVGFTACKSKPKLMTPEEVTSAVDQKFNEQKAVMEPELNKLCDAQFPLLVKTAQDSLVLLAAATPAQ